MTLFDNTPAPVIDPAKEYLPELVGEGKKFKTPEDLAKGKLEADAFVERLKAEQAELRKELETRIKYEEFLDKMTSLEKTNGSTLENQPPKEPVVPQKAAMTDEDLAQKVDALLTQKEAQKKHSDNLDYVKEQLQTKLGPNYAQTIAGQAKTLGLSQKDLDGMAATTPKAFLQLFGITEQKQAVKDSIFSPPKTSVNSATFIPASGAQKTQKYYQDMKAKDPKSYFSPRIANEMHQEALRLGEAFFDGT